MSNLVRVCNMFLAIYLCLSCANKQLDEGVLPANIIEEYVEGFNSTDEELYIQEIPNTLAAKFMKENIPVFECPDKELEKTWYFRWWTFRKHIKNTPEGYVITEFLPDVSWAGKYNAINCPGSHQFLEGRWLKSTQYLIDYAKFWCRETKDAQKYSFPIADSFYRFYLVHPNIDFIKETYPILKDIYMDWESSHRDSTGLFWQMDGLDGMEISISGALSSDATGYRATINSYMYADAIALSNIARILGNQADQEKYSKKAEIIKNNINNMLWDSDARFYKVIPRHQNFSFSPARELHGFVPWMYNIPESHMADAWKQLIDTSGFKSPFGPTTAERRSQHFSVLYEGHPCQWNGPSWPFATSQTLTALERHLHTNGQSTLSNNDFYDALITYSNSHRRINEKNQVVCWIDENLDPFTGEWIARKMLLQKGQKYKERGKDYNHSTFCDIIISGLIGISPQESGEIIIEPLIPENKWDYFVLTNLNCSNKRLCIMYDKTGKKYKHGKGFMIFVDGKLVAKTDKYSTRIII